MRIFVPCTKIIPETLKALEPYDYIPVKMSDLDDYLHYFQKRWKEGETFINIEHDTVFRSGAIESLEHCNEDFCSFESIVMNPEWAHGGEAKLRVPKEKFFRDGASVTFALTKFGSGFIERNPDVWDKMEKSDVILKFAPRWMWCDFWLNAYLRPKNVICHQHYPRVANANQRYLKLLEEGTLIRDYIPSVSDNSFVTEDGQIQIDLVWTKN